MKNKLAEEIAEKAGIPEDKALIAAETAIAFIKKRVASTVEAKVNETLEQTSKTIKAEVYEAVTGEPKETFMDKAGDFAEDAKEKIGEFAEDAKEKLSDFADSARKFFTNPFGKKDDEKEEKKEDDKKDDKAEAKQEEKK